MLWINLNKGGVMVVNGYFLFFYSFFCFGAGAFFARLFFTRYAGSGKKILEQLQFEQQQIKSKIEKVEHVVKSV